MAGHNVNLVFILIDKVPQMCHGHSSLFQGNASYLKGPVQLGQILKTKSFLFPFYSLLLKNEID